MTEARVYRYSARLFLNGTTAVIHPPPPPPRDSMASSIMDTNVSRIQFQYIIGRTHEVLPGIYCILWLENITRVHANVRWPAAPFGLPRLLLYIR